MSMPCTPDKQFPGAWPESPPRTPTVSPPPRQLSTDMDIRGPPLGESLEELHRPSSPSFCGGTATQSAKKPPPLRIVVPPSEYCPFSTDLTLPSTPLSLPTPVSSSCFTFSDRQELVHQSMSALPTPAPVQTACPQVTTVADFASPTSSQLLLMPPTPHLENADNEIAICVSPLTTPGATDVPTRNGSPGTKFENLRPWEISSSTWLSDLGGHTETDRMFRHNLLELGSLATESSPASTPALSPSALSPPQVSSGVAYNSPTSLARSPASLPPTLLPYPCTMSSHTCSPVRLVLKATGTDTFPSTLDSLQAWCEGVTPGFPQSEEYYSPLSEDIHSSRSGEPMPETPDYPSHQLHSHIFPPPVSRVSRSQTFIKHAKMFGGRVKRLVTLRSISKHRGSMDRGVNFRVVTSQDSENGSVILITAPPPPYDSRLPTLVSQGPTGQEHVRSRTISEYSSMVQTSTAEPGTTGMTESGSGQGSSNRNALRRLSFAALSTIQRF